MPAAAPITSRRRAAWLAVCAAPVAALLAVAALAPLPFAVAQPGTTVDVLGEDEGEPVIRVEGAVPREPSGELRLTTILATSPDTEVRMADVVGGYLDSQRAVLPFDSVYPVGGSTEEIREHNAEQMTRSQDAAVAAALAELGLDADEVGVELSVEGVGGPSAGLLFSLGVIELLDGDGSGGDLTGGRVIAGTGTIDADGRVGAVGGVPLKTQAARRDGATVFLVPAAECGAAEAELPEGLRLIPVETLGGALDALEALRTGGDVPACP